MSFLWDDDILLVLKQRVQGFRKVNLIRSNWYISFKILDSMTNEKVYFLCRMRNEIIRSTLTWNITSENAADLCLTDIEYNIIVWE